MLNKVTKKEIDDAFDYFMDTGRLEEVKSDDRYYIEILLKSIANRQNVKLVFKRKTLLDNNEPDPHY